MKASNVVVPYDSTNNIRSFGIKLLQRRSFELVKLTLTKLRPHYGSSFHRCFRGVFWVIFGHLWRWNISASAVSIFLVTATATVN